MGTFRQAVLALRWFRDRACVHCLDRDTDISPATGYRYLNEAIDVLAEQAPDLHQVLDQCREQGVSHVLPALYPAAIQGLPTLAEVGYVGAGIGVYTPLRPRPADQR